MLFICFKCFGVNFLAISLARSSSPIQQQMETDSARLDFSSSKTLPSILAKRTVVDSESSKILSKISL